MLDIDEKYLYNFTNKEKALFRKQSRRENADLAKWQLKFYELFYSDSPAIFGNYDPRPYSKLDVKYTINRLALNDPKLIHLPFGYGDEVMGNSDAIKIAKAIKTNTHCQSYEFRGCCFSDRGAILILRALKDKAVSIILTDPYLSDATFEYVAQVMSDPQNKWKQLDLGPIFPSTKTKAKLDQNPKIKYSIKSPGMVQRFLMKHCCQRG